MTTDINSTMDKYTKIKWCTSCTHREYAPFSDDWNYFCLNCNQSDSRSDENNFEQDQKLVCSQKRVFVYTLKTKNGAFSKVIDVWENVDNRPRYLNNEAFQSSAWRRQPKCAKNIIMDNLDIAEDIFEAIFIWEFG